MPRVFIELRPYRLFKFPNRANPSLYIIFSLVNTLCQRALRHDCALYCPSSPIAPPSTKLASPVLLRHWTAGKKEADSATVAPPSRPRCALRRASIAPSCVPLSRRLCCALVSPSFVPPLRPPSCLRRPTSPRSPTAITWRQTLHYCFVPLLRRVFCASFTISSHHRTTNSPRGKFKTRYFFFVLYFFYDLGNCFGFWWGFWLIFALFFCYFYGLLCILLSLIALEDLSIVGVHHLPLSFNFHAPRFLILLFCKILLSIMY